MCPRFAGIGRFINAVTVRDVWTVQTLAAAYIDDIRIRRGNRERPDGTRRLVIEDRKPNAPSVRRLPNTAVVLCHVENARL